MKHFARVESNAKPFFLSAAAAAASTYAIAGLSVLRPAGVATQTRRIECFGKKLRVRNIACTTFVVGWQSS
jgi:hypothetical protein